MTTALLCVVCVLSLNVLIDVATAIPTHHLKGQGGRDIGKKQKKVQVGKDQEKAQSERDSHSKTRGGKKPN